MKSLESTRNFLCKNEEAFIRLRGQFEGYENDESVRAQYYINHNLVVVAEDEEIGDYHSLIFHHIGEHDWDVKGRRWPKQDFENGLIIVVANRYARRGYNHRAVVWALHNQAIVPEGWVIPEAEKSTEDPNPEKTANLKRYAEMLEEKHFRERAAAFHKEISKDVLHETTFENWSGEHGYTEYDLKNQVVSGYKVYCWGSQSWGGGCHCNNHDPGDSFERPLTDSDIAHIRNNASKMRQVA
jgi:hypothetical protein